MKLCKKCNTLKPLSEMVKRSDSPDGYRHLCISCRTIHNAQYWRENAWRLTKRNHNYKHRSPETYAEILKQQKEYKATHRERNLWLQARKRARTLNLNFSISINDIKIPKMCPLLGIPINNSPSKIKNRDHSPSIDRIIPSKGYVPDNIIVISYRANRIKNDASLEELTMIAKNLKKYRQLCL